MKTLNFLLQWLAFVLIGVPLVVLSLLCLWYAGTVSYNIVDALWHSGFAEGWQYCHPVAAILGLALSLIFGGITSAWADSLPKRAFPWWWSITMAQCLAWAFLGRRPAQAGAGGPIVA